MTGLHVGIVYEAEFSLWVHSFHERVHLRVVFLVLSQLSILCRGYQYRAVTNVRLRCIVLAERPGLSSVRMLRGRATALLYLPVLAFGSSASVTSSLSNVVRKSV